MSRNILASDDLAPNTQLGCLSSTIETSHGLSLGGYSSTRVFLHTYTNTTGSGQAKPSLVSYRSTDDSVSDSSYSNPLRVLFSDTRGSHFGRRRHKTSEGLVQTERFQCGTRRGTSTSLSVFNGARKFVSNSVLGPGGVGSDWTSLSNENKSKSCTKLRSSKSNSNYFKQLLFGKSNHQMDLDPLDLTPMLCSSSSVAQTQSVALYSTNDLISSRPCFDDSLAALGLKFVQNDVANTTRFVCVCVCL